MEATPRAAVPGPKATAAVRATITVGTHQHAVVDLDRTPIEEGKGSGKGHPESYRRKRLLPEKKGQHDRTRSSVKRADLDLAFLCPVQLHSPPEVRRSELARYPILMLALPATINAAILLAIAISLVTLLFKESSSRVLSFEGTLCPIEDPLRWVNTQG